MAPDARVLRYFLAVAEESSFTRAAQRLGIAQPALSAQIRRLETELGVDLLLRTTRRVEVTPAGRVLVERGPSALAALDALWTATRKFASGEAGLARIAYSPTAGHETAPALLSAVRHRFPEVTVQAEMLSTPAIPGAVARGDVDAGITRGAHPGAGTKRLPLRHERRGVLVRREHPLARRRVVGVSDVAKYPVALHAKKSNPAHYDEVHQLFARVHPSPQWVQPALTMDPGQLLIRTTDTVAIAGVSIRAALPADVRWIPLDEGCPPATVYLVLPANEPTPLQSSIRAAARELARERHWLTQLRAVS